MLHAEFAPVHLIVFFFVGAFILWCAEFILRGRNH
jgi:hypothetical protein